jgi:UPF0755 protein
LIIVQEKDFSPLFSFLVSKPSTVSLEGYLFPDTYRFFDGVSTEEILVKILTNFERKFSPNMKVTLQESGHTLHELVTMASIIEREVQTNEDRVLVSDIFWRRLKVGMPLQADSTVNYITEKNTPFLSYEDRELDSLWNTYKYTGLPPGPIANPGLKALQAALFPQANSYWYFLTDKEGNVYYARTNEEQNENKARYLK